MLVQVAGRAGRADQPGLAMLQTAAPETDVLQRLLRGDRAGLKLRAGRAAAEMPPHARLAAIMLSATSPAMVNESAAHRARRARYDGVTVLGPAPAPMAVLRGRHRMRFLSAAAVRLIFRRSCRNGLKLLNYRHLCGFRLILIPIILSETASPGRRVLPAMSNAPTTGQGNLPRGDVSAIRLASALSL